MQLYRFFKLIFSRCLSQWETLIGEARLAAPDWLSAQRMCYQFEKSSLAYFHPKRKIAQHWSYRRINENQIFLPTVFRFQTSARESPLAVLKSYIFENVHLFHGDRGTTCQFVLCDWSQ